MFVERYGWEWPSIRDPERRLARSLGADYQPHVFVIDPEGRLVGAFEGGGDEATWESLAELVS